MATKLEADQGRDDIRLLMREPAFRRFLFRLTETSGIYSATYGAEVAVLFAEGRRSLGLEILGWISEAHPLTEQSAVPLNALLPILTEEANSRATKEATSGPRRTDRYDRNRELPDRPVGDGDGDDE